MSLSKNSEYMESVYKHFDKLCHWLEEYHIEMLNSIELLIIKALIREQLEWCDIYEGYDEWVKAEMEKEDNENDS